MTTSTPGHVDRSGLPSGHGRRREPGGGAPSGPLGPPHRRRHGMTLVGVPVPTLVAVELVAICGLLVAEKRLVVAVIAAIVGLVILVAALPLRGTIRVGTWALLRIGYLLRRRETLVAAREYGGGRPPASDEGVDVPPEVEAFFPGLTVWESPMHDGARMGIVQWHGSCAATLRVGTPGGIVRWRTVSDNVPIAAIMAALEGQDLGLDSVQVVTQTIVGEHDPAFSPLVAVAAAELAGSQPMVRNRSTFVTVRVDPATASESVAARGGGTTGVGRVLSAALNRVQAAAGRHGLDAEVLGAGAAVRAIAEGLHHQATAYDPIVKWTESVRHIASTRMAHRSLVVAGVRGPALAALPLGNVFAYAIGTQAQPSPDGGWSTRTVLRLTCRTAQSLDVAEREVRVAARRAGVTLLPLDAVQHLGVRATVPVGGS